MQAVNDVGYGYTASVTATPPVAGDFAGGRLRRSHNFNGAHLNNVHLYLDKHLS